MSLASACNSEERESASGPRGQAQNTTGVHTKHAKANVRWFSRVSIEKTREPKGGRTQGRTLTFPSTFRMRTR